MNDSDNDNKSLIRVLKINTLVHLISITVNCVLIITLIIYFCSLYFRT